MSGKVEFCENRHSCSHTSLWKWSVKELLPGIFIFLEQFDISSVQNIQVISSRKYEFVKIGVMKAVLYSTGVNKFASAFSKTFSPLGWYLVQAHKNLLSNSRVKKKNTLLTGVNEITFIAYRENLRHLESDEHLGEAPLHTVQYFHSSLCMYYSINQLNT